MGEVEAQLILLPGYAHGVRQWRPVVKFDELLLPVKLAVGKWYVVPVVKIYVHEQPIYTLTSFYYTRIR